MTKQSLNKLEKLFYILAIVLAVASIALIFTTAVMPTEFTGVKQKIDGGFYGYEIVFGIKDGELTGLKFSFLALLPYLFVIAGIVLVILRLIKKITSRKYDYLISLLFLIATILFMFSNFFLVFSSNLVGELFSSFSYRISYGTIISGVCSFLAGGLVIANAIIGEYVKPSEAKTKENASENVIEQKETAENKIAEDIQTKEETQAEEGK